MWLLFVLNLAFALPAPKAITVATPPPAPKCYSASDVKAGICWAMCRNDGYDTGTYEPKGDECFCAQKHKFKDFTKSVIKIPSRQNMKVVMPPDEKPKTTYYPSWSSPSGDEGDEE